MTGRGHGDFPIFGLDVGGKVGNYRGLGLRKAVQGQESLCEGPEVRTNVVAAVLNSKLQMRG